MGATPGEARWKLGRASIPFGFSSPPTHNSHTGLPAWEDHCKPPSAEQVRQLLSRMEARGYEEVSGRHYDQLTTVPTRTGQASTSKRFAIMARACFHHNGGIARHNSRRECRSRLLKRKSSRHEAVPACGRRFNFTINLFFLTKPLPVSSSPWPPLPWRQQALRWKALAPQQKKTWWKVP